MPEGQFSGTRTAYEYTSDSGDKYLLTLDTTLGSITGTGLTAATTATIANPAPKRFKPRVVFWEGTLSGRKVRKKIVCETSGGLYAASTSQPLSIDGVAGATTGKRGEKITFVKLPLA